MTTMSRFATSPHDRRKGGSGLIQHRPPEQPFADCVKLIEIRAQAVSPEFAAIFLTAQIENERNAESPELLRQRKGHIGLEINVDDSAIELALTGENQVGVNPTRALNNSICCLEQALRLFIQKETIFQHQQSLARETFKLSQTSILSLADHVGSQPKLLFLASPPRPAKPCVSS